MNDHANKRTRAGRVGGRYVNPPGAPRPDCGLAGLARFLWRRALDRGVPELPAGHVHPPERVRPDWAAGAGAARMAWLGHATFLLRLGHRTLLTDPFLSDVAAPAPLRMPCRFVPPAMRVDELPPVDCLLVSHSHYDHLDAPTVAALAERPAMDVVVPAGLGPFFRRHGHARVHELDWWEAVRVDGLTITAVPALHFSRRGAFDRNRVLWCGFVADDGERRVYFAGDTAYGSVFREIGAAFGPIDAALVPIGAYEPRSVMRAVHVDPEEAAALCSDVGAQSAVAMHWGTIVLTDEPPFEPPGRWRRAMRERGYAQSAIRVPAIGRTLTL